MTQPTVPPLKRQPLKKILALTRSDWDHEKIRPAAREAFRKVLDCGTAALGAEVFASDNGERVVYHTCKSRACPSCGYRATTLWQREQWRDLPDTRYSHVTLTMPDVLWPLFQQNRHLLHDLPVLGAKIIEHWVFQTYGVRLMILVIPHTFGRRLNFNCHLHVLVSEGGLNADGTAWRRAPLKHKALMPLWRYAVVTHLREAYRRGLLDTDQTRSQLADLLRKQQERWWSTHIQRFRGKKQFLAYAGRYARRPPIAQRRFKRIDRHEVQFLTKDTRTKRMVTTKYTPADFVARLADHVPDRYRNNIRYFGLLAPRTKARTHDTVFALLGQERLGKPRRLSWAASIRKSFGVDPLLDEQGDRMRWVSRLPATRH